MAGLCSQQADTACRIRTIIRHGSLPQQRFDNRRRELFGELDQLIGGVEGAAAGEDGDLFTLVEDISRPLEITFRRQVRRVSPDIAAVLRPVTLRAHAFLQFH